MYYCIFNLYKVGAAVYSSPLRPQRKADKHSQGAQVTLKRSCISATLTLGLLNMFSCMN